jgi:PKD repeat protein
MIMERSRVFTTLRRGAAIMAVAVFASACAVDNQEAPALAGPSGFAQSLSLTAAPQVLSRDGSSMSTISVTARNADGSPAVGRRLLFTAASGTLLTTEVLTNNDGRAAVVYVAPSRNEPVSSVTIVVTPIEVGNSVNTHSTSLRLELLGPDVPVGGFTFSPTSAAVLDAVTFDASSTFLKGRACGSACSYSWDFDDGSSDDEITVQHKFSSSGVFNVTLTATSLADGTSNSVTKPVVIQPPSPPVANFRFGVCVPAAAACERFTDLSTVGSGATITSQVWEFNDGTSPATGTPVEHTFPVAATTYDVKLTVTDSLGRTATVTRSVAVP